MQIPIGNRNDRNRVVQDAARIRNNNIALSNPTIVLGAIPDYRKKELQIMSRLMFYDMPPKVGHQTMVQILINRLQKVCKTQTEFDFSMEILIKNIKKAKGKEVELWVASDLDPKGRILSKEEAKLYFEKRGVKFENALQPEKFIKGEEDREVQKRGSLKESPGVDYQELADYRKKVDEKLREMQN